MPEVAFKYGCSGFCGTRLLPGLVVHFYHCIALDSDVKAKENGIYIVTLPPHTSNKTQPLDLSAFAAVTTYFNSAANSWMMEHSWKTITTYEMAKLMGSACLKAATPVTILSGFRFASIWPLDRDVFSSEQFVWTGQAVRNSNTLSKFSPRIDRYPCSSMDWLSCCTHESRTVGRMDTQTDGHRRTFIFTMIETVLNLQ